MIRDVEQLKNLNLYYFFINFFFFFYFVILPFVNNRIFILVFFSFHLSSVVHCVDSLISKSCFVFLFGSLFRALTPYLFLIIQTSRSCLKPFHLLFEFFIEDEKQDWMNEQATQDFLHFFSRSDTTVKRWSSLLTCPSIYLSLNRSIYFLSLGALTSSFLLLLFFIIIVFFSLNHLSKHPHMWMDITVLVQFISGKKKKETKRHDKGGQVNWTIDEHTHRCRKPCYTKVKNNYLSLHLL